MQEPLEDKKRWVRHYVIWLWIFGGVVTAAGIVYGAIGCAEFIYKFARIKDHSLILNILWPAIGTVAAGLILIGIGQLLAYIFARCQKVPRLLRYGDRGLFFLAGLNLLFPVLILFFDSHLLHHSAGQWLAYMIILSKSLACVLMLVTIGLILRRVLPIIEEYHSTV